MPKRRTPELEEVEVRDAMAVDNSPLLFRRYMLPDEPPPEEDRDVEVDTETDSTPFTVEDLKKNLRIDVMELRGVLYVKLFYAGIVISESRTDLP